MEQEDYTISILKFVDEFAKLIAKKKKRLPYHLNLIDELHINENGHSRILFKLLCFQNSKKEYEFLESLISYILTCKHADGFKKIHISAPNITQETERIDLWVRDEDYAIIFENKACNAQDQDAQICRYIEKTKNHDYKDEQIFVIYLPPTNEKEPSNQSWGNYKDTYANRYVNLSFKEDVIPWLENAILPNIRQKDIYLQSAISQYVDYLRGIFNLRKDHNQLNMETNKLIAERYNLNQCESDLQRVGVLDEKLQEMDNLRTQIDNLRKEYRMQIFSKLSNRAKEDFPEYYELFRTTKNKDLVAVAIRKDGDRLLFVTIGEEKDMLYCQIVYDYDLPEERRFFSEGDRNRFADILKRDYLWEYCLFRYYEKNAFDECYDCFKLCVKQCIDWANN